MALRTLLLLLIFFRIQSYVYAQNPGVLFLIAGQSNAVGQGDSLLSAKYSSAKIFDFDIINNRFNHLKDPAGQNWKMLEMAKYGSMMPSFAHTYSELAQRSVFMVSAARGGSSCHEKAALRKPVSWDTSGTVFNDAVEKTNKAIQLSKTKLSGIIWLQGERDANAILDKIITPEEYRVALTTLIKRFRKEFGKKTPFYIVQTGYQTGRAQTGTNAVRHIQLQLAQKIRNVHIAYSDTDSFLQKKWMVDHVHYNQEALNNIGENVARYIFPAQKK